MIYVALMLGLLMPWLTGLGLVLATPGAAGRSARGWPWAVICALPVGYAAHVLLASLILLVTPGWVYPFMVLMPELLLAGGVFGWGVARFVARSRRFHELRGTYVRIDLVISGDATPPERHRLLHFGGCLLNLGFFVSLGLLGWLLLAEVQRMPLGYFDAWHIWDFKARIIGLGQDHWRWFLSAPQAQMSHQEYPLGFSVFVGRMYLFNGDAHALFNQAVAVGAGLLWPLLIWSCVLRNRGSYHAGFTGFVCLAFPFAIVQSSWQYADVPLACMAALAVGWHYTYCRRPDLGPRPDRVGPLVFGLILGALFWLKNEGMVIALALLLVTTVDHARTSGCRRALVRLGLVLVPLVVFVLMALHIKLAAPEVTDLIKDHTADKQAQALTDLDRMRQIVLFFWGLITNLVDLVTLTCGLLCGLLIGLARRRAGRWLPAWYCAAIVMTLAGYSLVLLLSPYDLQWHLGTAANRLLIHLWPALILAASLLVKPADRVIIPAGPNVSGRIFVQG